MIELCVCTRIKINKRFSIIWVSIFNKIKHEKMKKSV